jgi:hypothetical protein
VASSSLGLRLVMMPTPSNISRLICILLIAIIFLSLLSTLRSLDLDYFGVETSSHYVALDQFFSQCVGIRNLRNYYFYFKDDPSYITQNIKDGFYRLSRLSIVECRGDLRMFVVSVPIPNLRSFCNERFRNSGEEDIVSAVAISYPTIKRLHLNDAYDSSVTLLKFVECCRDIEELSFVDWSGDVELKRSDIEAIASLPRLKLLNTNCRITDDAVSVLSRCKGLKHLTLGWVSFDLNNIIPTIGRNLVSLDYTSSTPILETARIIVEKCQNLHLLDLGCEELNARATSAAVDLLKGGLKKLSKLKVDRTLVRLGTYWEGYS